jgi:lipopolysaccharide/colanic/teichoic acid biosynthesis glycosyltransferase
MDSTDSEGHQMILSRTRDRSEATAVPLLLQPGFVPNEGMPHTVRWLDAKRQLDIVGAFSALILLSPVFLFVALLIKLTSRGPVFFAQQRVGQYGVSFLFFKFRSMRVGAPLQRAKLLCLNQHGEGITFKLKRDPRVSWFGRIIRTLSIDELPQLWNVLKGDMSLVGPRPPIPEEVARYRPEHFARLSVLPGLTCFWQVSGRAELGFEDQVRLDLMYISSQTFWLDVRLLLLTIPAVLSRRGAY